jgi:4'-phosphopantetheinyl transferase
VLDAAEQARAARFRLDRDRRRFGAARAAVRVALGARVGVAPADVRFTIGEHGKPAVAEGLVEFNVSHSADVAVVAVAGAGMPVGVDIEFERDVRFDDLARRFFSPAECAAVAAAGDDAGARRAAFFRCWTRKEAFVKGLGVGLSMPLSSFDVAVDGPPALLAVRGLPGEQGQWSLHDVIAPAGAWAALAVRSTGQPVVMRTGQDLCP